MPTPNDPITIYDQGTILRYRPPINTPRRIALLLHGWTGDETSMWVFVRKLNSHWLLAPRGPIPALPQGFGWAARFANYPILKITAITLLQQLDHWQKTLALPDLPLDVIGFSQGAAMAITLALSAPDRITRLACIAGFLPHAAPIVPLPRLQCLVAHGTQDTIIPLQQAQQAAQHLRSCQAAVEFCQAEVGHKMSTACFQALENFLNVS